MTNRASRRRDRVSLFFRGFWPGAGALCVTRSGCAAGMTGDPLPERRPKQATIPRPWLARPNPEPLIPALPQNIFFAARHPANRQNPEHFAQNSLAARLPPPRFDAKTVCVTKFVTLYRVE